VPNARKGNPSMKEFLLAYKKLKGNATAQANTQTKNCKRVCLFQTTQD
jgi:hypothetical protein